MELLSNNDMHVIKNKIVGNVFCFQERLKKGYYLCKAFKNYFNIKY